MDILEKVMKEGRRRGLRERTIENYCYCIEKFLNYIDKDVKSVSKKDIIDYLNYLQERKKLSGSSLNVHLNALKFCFKELLGRRMNLDIRYSRVPRRLPVVLSKEEVKRLLDSIKNLKHRFMIAFMYSTGLRVSELVNFKVKDLELDKKIGYVRDGKGGKDRQIIISDKLLDGLKRIVMYSKDRKDYLFLTNRDKQYSPRSVYMIVKKASKRAKINKKVHPHTLRHSFATHLIHNNYSVGDVQQVMGHNSAETTMIYVHCASKMLDIESPLDSL